MQLDSNNRRRTVTQRSFVFQFTLTATQEGAVVIPPPTVTENGKTYAGPQTTFRALLPSPSQDDELILTFDRTRLYQNETIEGECVWWIGDSTSEFNFSSSNLPESFEIRPVPVPGGAKYTLDFPLAGQSLTGRVDTAFRDGRERSRFSFRFTITPTETGTFELGPMRAIFTRQSGTGSRYRAYIDSNTIEFDVIPVPSTNQPEPYEGAIGTFELEARASNYRVNVGDPIDLTLRIEGQEPMTGVQSAPDLNLFPEFSEQFKIDSDGWREIMPRRNGVRIYETTLRALSDSVSEIPPIKLASFEPTRGEYEIYKSDSIPLEVAAVKEVTLADALVSNSREGPSTPTRPAVEHIALSPAAPGLWAHGTPNEMRQQQGFDLATTIQQPVWIATIATPPLTYLSVVLIAGYRRRRDPELLRVRRAYRNAQSRSGVDALRAYLSGVLNIDQEAVVASDAMQLKTVDADLRRKAYTMLLRSEGVASDQGSKEDTLPLLRSLHEQSLTTMKGGRS
jgi:hypothetical protein